MFLCSSLHPQTKPSFIHGWSLLLPSSVSVTASSLHPCQAQLCNPACLVDNALADPMDNVDEHHRGAVGHMNKLVHHTGRQWWLKLSAERLLPFEQSSAMLSLKRLKFTFMLLSAQRCRSIHHILMLIFKPLLITSTENGVSNNESPQCWLPEAAQDFKSLSTLLHSNSLCCTLQHCRLKTASWLME